MSNLFKYRCPECGGQDHIHICALVSVRLTSTGAEIDEALGEIGPNHWTCENGAGCNACGFEGAVKDFEPRPARLVSLNEFRRRC